MPDLPWKTTTGSYDNIIFFMECIGTLMLEQGLCRSFCSVFYGRKNPSRNRNPDSA
jgi:hypothetical protein